MSKMPTAADRQRLLFKRLIAVAQSAYLDGQGELATWALQVAWLACDRPTVPQAVTLPTRAVGASGVLVAAGRPWPSL